MKTVSEISKIAGISKRTLHYYDKIGLLSPTEYSDAGYRLYSESDLLTIQQILLFRELEFPLNEIKEIINSDNFDKNKALEQQIELLTLKKERLENLINFAKKIKLREEDYMDFRAFDKTKIDEYAQSAKATWGNTKEFKEFERKQKNKSDKETQTANQQLMLIFAEFGKIKSEKYDSEEAKKLVKKLQDFITNNFYTCSNEILSSLGEMYASGGEFTKNIDDFAGEGTAVFVNKAIDHFC